MIKQALRFLLSLKTTIALLCALLFLLLAGAFIMPAREEFRKIHETPMLIWLKTQPFEVSWWLWGALIVLSLLTANTLLCSVESIVKKRNGTQWLLLISPQIIHAGFLFILLAHLLSSLGGYKSYVGVQEGMFLNIDETTTLQVKDIHIALTPDGYISDWAVDVAYVAGGKVLRHDSLLPNKPSLFEGIGVYAKDFRVYPEKAVLLEISREPGAVWALIGGILFMAGTITLLALRMKRDSVQ
jgi:hypothetical protein